VQTLYPGSALVTATHAGISGSATVTIKEAGIRTITLTSDSATIAVGESLPIRAHGTYSDGSVYDLTHLAGWTCSNAKVASVTNDPDARGVVHANGEGTTSIVARYGGWSGQLSLTVTPAAAHR
jgi:trimeric autotransporter adhesin